jgi:hypothetical protein
MPRDFPKGKRNRVRVVVTTLEGTTVEAASDADFRVKKSPI